jgi:hypothetical protein
MPSFPHMPSWHSASLIKHTNKFTFFSSLPTEYRILPEPILFNQAAIKTDIQIF